MVGIADLGINHHDWPALRTLHETVVRGLHNSMAGSVL